jgi:GT2 family glycosyltransferase
MGANCGMRRDAWQRLGGFAEGYVVASEDVELFWRAQLEGYEMGYAAGAAVHYRLPDSVRGLARQAFAYGRSHPRLYRDFTRFGMPRSAPRGVLRQWAWLASHPLSIARGRGARGLWLSRLALRLGRLAGSIQNRVVYL